MVFSCWRGLSHQPHITRHPVLLSGKRGGIGNDDQASHEDTIGFAAHPLNKFPALPDDPLAALDFFI